jgi:adenylate cyclase
MVVGFMGTPSKMDYTIMGNAVNLTARLEGVNKQYDTHGILISEYTKNQIGDDFVTRPLSRVTVVGIPVPLRLYELLEFKAEASSEMLEMIEIWEGAFKAFENQDFETAKKIFADTCKKNPEDTPAQLYLKRCEKYIVTPPPPGWNGVDNLMEK